MIDRRRDGGLPPPPGAVLVAADGVGGLDAPLRLADLIARRHRVPAHVVGAVSPLSPVPRLLSAAAGVKAGDLEERRRDSEHARLGRRLEEGGHGSRFGISVLSGNLVDALATTARSSSSPYALIGLPAGDDPLRRVGETRALRLAQSGVPVLAVPDSAAALPRTALVCADLTRGGDGAAHAAAPLLADDGQLVLAHIAPSGFEAAVDVGRATDRLHQLAVGLRLPAATRVYIVILHADPVRTLARSAGNFDLVALGVSESSGGRSAFRPSISRAVLRYARGSVLLAPAGGLPPHPAGSAAELTRSYPGSSPASPVSAPGAEWRSSPTRSPSSRHSSGTGG